MTKAKEMKDRDGEILIQFQKLRQQGIKPTQAYKILSPRFGIVDTYIAVIVSREIKKKET